ncbi:MAG: Fic family protein [Ignavibacteria bacterium]|nr:Fic family protein [Ignavibacteria bacterium]
MSKEKSVLLELLTKVDDLKKEIDAFHPLPVDVEERILQKLRLDWNYNSNAIEGNTLSYGETYVLIMDELTAQGKPLKDSLYMRGHNKAINYLINFVRNKEELTEAAIRELHKTILVEPYEIDAVTADGKPTKRTVTPGAYKTQPNHVKTATGEMHYFATPEETPAKMQDLMTWYRKTREDKEVHPVVLAAFFHHHFVSIHPFDDGNGRMARLLMNLLLMQSNYPPVVIKTKDKNNYYLALSQADAGNTSPFTEYVANALIHSEEIYLKGARGESIEELDDIDKEIILFKKELDGREDKIETKKSEEVLNKFYYNSIMPSIEKLNFNLSSIRELFLKSKTYWAHSNPFQQDNFSFVLDHAPKEMTFNILLTHLGSDLFCYVFTFEDFKIASNPFSFSLSLHIYFLEYKYQIKYFIDAEPITINSLQTILSDNFIQTFVDNYYHQEISKAQMDKLVQSIKKDLFDFIKEKSNGK